MNPVLKRALEHELSCAKNHEEAQDYSRAFGHLERAHVLSQPYAWPHVRVHLQMLAFAWRRRDAHELLGQLTRTLLAGPGSWLGRAPLGNTGGANVGMFEPMAVPEDLQRILDEPG